MCSYLFYQQFITVSLLTILNLIMGKVPDICESPKCSLVIGPESEVVQFCHKGNTTGEFKLVGFCCINTTETDGRSVVGLDRSSCGADTVNIELSRFPNLNYLSLPSTKKCPGSNSLWEQVQTLENATVCLQQVNLCLKNNLTCPNNNSHCEMVGPGEAECVCNKGYHGYKCLRQGTFPDVGFSIVLSACTVVLSALLWFTQRRKVTHHTH